MNSNLIRFDTLQRIEITRIFSTFYIKFIVIRRFFIYTQYAREKNVVVDFSLYFFSAESKCFDPFNIRHAFAIGYGLRRASMALERNAEKKADVFDWKNSITYNMGMHTTIATTPPVCNLCAMIFYSEHNCILFFTIQSRLRFHKSRSDRFRFIESICFRVTDSSALRSQWPTVFVLRSPIMDFSAKASIKHALIFN